MIRENMKLRFNPNASAEIHKVFSDDMARLLYLATRQGHLADQYFPEKCLRYAEIIRREIEKSGKMNVEKLSEIIVAMGVVTYDEESFFADLLPFINGEKVIHYKIVDDMKVRI